MPHFIAHPAHPDTLVNPAHIMEMSRGIVTDSEEPTVFYIHMTLAGGEERVWDFVSSTERDEVFEILRGTLS